MLLLDKLIRPSDADDRARPGKFLPFERRAIQPTFEFVLFPGSLSFFSAAPITCRLIFDELRKKGALGKYRFRRVHLN